MKFRSVFITGTDTGVGKTTVSCGIAAAFSLRGMRVGVYKPVETGCPVDASGAPQPDDARRLKYFSDCRLDLKTVCPYPLLDPLAPLMAAEREGVQIHVDDILRHYQAIATTHDVTLIEGAGGLLVPVAAAVTFADLAVAFETPLLVIVGSRLGAINHALLTLRYAASVGLEVLGYVINFPAAGADVAAQTNVAVLADWLGPPLGVMPHLGELEMTTTGRQRLADVVSAQIRLDDLLVPC